MLYLAIPPALPQPPGWSPRPDHASEVAALYRSHLGLTGLVVGPEQLRLLNPALLVLAALGYVVLFWSRPRGAPLPCIAIVCGALAVGSWLMPPLYATDIFYYAASGEIVASFGANPYVLTPSDFPASIMLGFNYWTSITSPYGPIWTSVATATATVTSSDPFWCTLLLKAVGLVSLLASAALLAIFLRRTQPGATRMGVTLFALNPFVWLLAVGDGHVDIVMAVLMLCAACLLARTQMLSSWCAIALATLVKYLTGPLLPLFFLARLRANVGSAARLRLVLVMGVCLAILTMITWAPYWAGLTTISSLLEEGGRGYSSPALLALQAVGDVIQVPDGVVDLVVDLAAKFMLAGLVAVLVWAARATFRGPADVVNEVRCWALTMAAVPALLPRSHPWYLLTGMALLAAVHPRARWTTIAVYVAAGLWLFWRVGRI